MASQEPMSDHGSAGDLPGSLRSLRFDNRFLDRLPVDTDTEVRPRQVVAAVASRVEPVTASAPTLLAHSEEVADLLGLEPELWTAHRDQMAEILVGNRLLDGMDPHAMNYGGHQFGHWAGQLGDGRAIALGELVTADRSRQTLQLKGAGPTPYSRGADGFAVLRSSVREFLCSEAMHHLGVPTTRALSLATTGDKVVRDMFYDGNPRPEPGAVVCRVAPSFIRFGNFQILAARSEIDLLRRLADYTVEEYFETAAKHPSGDPARYGALFAEVARTTLDMVVDWMRVGFVHGVMNTDNMSIHGLTIDYGPYGWLEGFDPGWTPNTTDAAHRRYRYGQQPQVAHWNLLQLANALVPLTEDTGPFQEVLDDFGAQLGPRERDLWRSKCGLDQIDDTAAADSLLEELFQILTSTETDMTIFFRALADLVAETDARFDAVPSAVTEAYYDTDQALTTVGPATVDWLNRYLTLGARDPRGAAARAAAMNEVNPRYVLRNYLAQQAIDRAEEGDTSEIESLLAVLRRPYDRQPGHEAYAAKRPEWARERPGCSQLSCSS